ncbi:MAG: hypothetical protein GX911_00020 [Spirochaetales bacterium]|nr:hypothetical protein [Spirochaetales bacterium]
MKKTLIIIAAIALLFSSCNADATGGLFKTITEAREALTIKHMQVVGRKGANDTLWFLTREGLFVKKNNATGAESVVKSVEGNRVQSSAYLNDAAKLLYKTDKDDGSLFEYDPATNVTTPKAVPPAPITDFRLMPNGKVVLKGAKDSGEFWVADYNDLNNGKKIDAGAGFDLYGLFTPSDYEKSDTSKEFILSFVKSGSPNEYRNYYHDGTNVKAMNNDLGPIANFAVIGTDLYILTDEGALHHVKTNTLNVAVKLKDNTVGYERNAFFYPVDDGTNVHFITNPSSSDSMSVFSVVKADPNADTTTVGTIKNGYAAVLKDTFIVSSLKLDEETFLVATQKHGMYSVKVDKNNVSKNDDTNVQEISKAEEYTF